MGKCVSKEYVDEIERGNIVSDIIQDTTYEEDEQLRSIDISHVSDVVCSEKPIRARVIDVYDGDTITVVFFVGSEPVQMKIRLNGIDTPEIRAGKGKLKIEKIAGKKCRDYLNSLVGDKIVTLVIYKWDKYGGRMVGDIYVDGMNISQHIIEKGYANPYDGGTKHKWTEQELRIMLDRMNYVR